MQSFMNRNFLLSSPTAEKLFFDYAKDMPIIDYHCHLSPKEIATDVRYENIAQVWLSGDHYKWRLMRSCGIEEAYITGDASDYDKFYQYACALEKAPGNPLFAWSHLELQRYFNYFGILNHETAKDVWNLCNEKLTQSGMSAQGLIMASNVDTLCTTDDPTDSLEYHIHIRKSQQYGTMGSFSTKVLPAFRPDRAVDLEKPDFPEYMEKLSQVSGISIGSSFDQLLSALKNRMDFFDSVGCRLSDHGMSFVWYSPASDEQTVRDIFARRMNGEVLTQEEILTYKTALMMFFGKECHRLGWTMQLHFCVIRNTNDRMFSLIGPDTGYDCISNYSPALSLTGFLNALESTGQLPRTILYSLNPEDNTLIDSVIGCFQNSDAVGKLQHGAAWWFNDHKDGMMAQMKSLSALGAFGTFVGMLTDSRSFLSYPRHEYFRRVLCDLVVHSSLLEYNAGRNFQGDVL